MTFSVWTALRVAALVLILAGRLDLTVVSTLCMIDNALVEGSVDTAGVSLTHLAVEVRALGHCQMDKSVVKIKKRELATRQK